MSRGIYRTLDKKFPLWFEFGSNIELDKYDISDGVDDVLTGISKTNLDVITDERNSLVRLITKLSEELEKTTSFEYVDNILETFDD